ncbi:MAG: hypothetical protein EPO01_08470 [Aquabacterium sp.]|nr:MAG: hypothetical protein EPO01_08470 [Aquabacterium sp.]
MHGADSFVPLNRSEHTYVSIGNMIGSVLQTYYLRFDVPVAEGQVRRALRDLVDRFPRLRSAVEPTLGSWRLRILNDERVVDQLFDVAFRVERGVDPESREQIEAYAARQMNEPVAFERGMPMRACFLPHAQHPVLIFCVEHYVCDGRSMIQLLTAIMALLNGRPVEPQPLESPSMLAAIVPQRLLDWPARVAASWRHRGTEKALRARHRMVTLDTERMTRFTTHGLRYHELPVSPDAMRVAAKQLGTTVNTLMLAATARAVLVLAKEDPQAMAAIRLSVDLRRYFPQGSAPTFGNYVATFFVHEPHREQAVDHMRSIEAQMREGLQRFERREMIFPWLPAELPRFIGRKLYAKVALGLRERDKLPAMSCHLSNLGDCTGINPPNAQVRLITCHATAPSSGPFLVTASVAGRTFLTLCWQNDRMDRAAADAFIQRIDRCLLDLVPQAEGGAVAAAA